MSPHGDLTCDCPFVAAARERYEDATASLRRRTAAAWVRWEDMPIDGRLTWVRDADHPDYREEWKP